MFHGSICLQSVAGDSLLPGIAAFGLLLSLGQKNAFVVPRYFLARSNRQKPEISGAFLTAPAGMPTHELNRFGGPLLMSHAPQSGNGDQPLASSEYMVNACPICRRLLMQAAR